VAQRGFLDGREGFVLAALSAFSVFTKYVRLWELNRWKRSS
jgi:(heptosyl)LPS beta-1,4-glucosyltransferase